MLHFIVVNVDDTSRCGFNNAMMNCCSKYNEHSSPQSTDGDEQALFKTI
jgi:hypothetical protein